VVLLLGSVLTALPLAASTVHIYVNFTTGNTVDVIDSVSHKVVRTINLAKPHGIAFSTDGKRVYVASESEKVLAVVNEMTGEIIKKVSVSGRPNQIAVTNDGKRLFVGIREGSGALDVIDTTSLERVKTIPMKGGLHDIYMTPDGKYVVAGSVDAKSVTIVDVRAEEAVWSVSFDTQVLTCAVESAPDGSTARIFVMRRFLHGFDVVDFVSRKIVTEIELPEEVNGRKIRHWDSACHGVDGAQVDCEDPDSPSHGIGVAPDNKTLWVNSHFDDAVFVYSLPDLKLLGSVLTGLKPDWITFAFSPGRKMVYDGNSGEETVSVIDAKTLKEVMRMPTARSPKRLNALVLP
jgi:DNA-binding beta-propeller fold protein YncE